MPPQRHLISSPSTATATPSNPPGALVWLPVIPQEVDTDA